MPAWGQGRAAAAALLLSGTRRPALASLTADLQVPPALATGLAAQQPAHHTAPPLPPCSFGANLTQVLPVLAGDSGLAEQLLDGANVTFDAVGCQQVVAGMNYKVGGEARTGTGGRGEEDSAHSAPLRFPPHIRPSLRRCPRSCSFTGVV